MRRTLNEGGRGRTNFLKSVFQMRAQIALLGMRLVNHQRAASHGPQRLGTKRYNLVLLERIRVGHICGK